MGTQKDIKINDSLERTIYMPDTQGETKKSVFRVTLSTLGPEAVYIPEIPLYPAVKIP